MCPLTELQWTFQDAAPSPGTADVDLVSILRSKVGLATYVWDYPFGYELLDLLPAIVLPIEP